VRSFEFSATKMTVKKYKIQQSSIPWELEKGPELPSNQPKS